MPFIHHSKRNSSPEKNRAWQYDGSIGSVKLTVNQKPGKQFYEQTMAEEYTQNDK